MTQILVKIRDMTMQGRISRCWHRIHAKSPGMMSGKDQLWLLKAIPPSLCMKSDSKAQLDMYYIALEQRTPTSHLYNERTADLEEDV